MIWTTHKPTQPGWYWYRWGIYKSVVKLEFGEYGILLVVHDEFVLVPLDDRFEWSGPIPEPTERYERETQP